MILTGFLVQNKLRKVWFFEETFLLVDTSIKMILSMFFLTFSNTDMQFVEKKLIWKSYKIVKALPITKKVKLINKREFAVADLDSNAKMFVIYIPTLLIAPTPAI